MSPDALDTLDALDALDERAATGPREWSLIERRAAAGVFWLGLVLLLGSAWWHGRGLWFFSDEWNVIAVHHSGHWMQGFNGQWLLVPTAFFWVLLKVFGLFTYWPFRLVGLAWYAAFVVVMRVWALRRVRPAVATVAVLAAAWYSTSWNVVMMPLLMNFTIPCVMLFASWLLLEREDRRGDVLVAVCLVVGVTSSNVGLVVALILAVEFLVGRTSWRRWWVFIPAAAVWIPWFLIWYEPISKRAAVNHAAHWGIGLTENYAKGFFDGWRFGQWVWLAALVALAVWAAWYRRWNARAIGITVGLGFFVAGAAFRAADFHIPIPPNPNWYLWFYSVLVAALVVELLRGERVPIIAVLAVAVVVAFGGFSLQRSLDEFHTGGVQLVKNNRTWFAGADAVGDRASGDATLGVNIVQLPVKDYATLRRDMGSLVPGVTLADLGDEGTRQAVDAWMAQALGIQLIPGIGAGRSCRVAEDVGTPQGWGVVPGVEVRITSGSAPATVRVRRFATGFPMLPVGQVAAGQTMHLAIPTDNSPIPWHVQVTGGATVLVCR
ncbi:MAG: hypothetical protein JST73_00030 [Actinobacteria bacterium]|nr:hypothetical protein [Actinomycetota bacterium]